MVEAHFPSVLIATPCYGGNMHVGYYRGLELIRNELNDAGVEYDMLITEGESNVCRARNTMVATFLNKTDYDVLAFIDSDIEFHSGEDFFNLLVDKTGVRGAAIACKTRDGSELLSCWKDGHSLKRNLMVEPHISVDYLGSAVLLIDRDVIKTLWSEHTFLSVDDPVYGEYPALFENAIVEKIYLTEDFSFCHLARQSGYEIFADTRVKCTHHGSFGLLW